MSAIDVINDIVVPAIIAGDTPNTEHINYNIIHKWYVSENRIKRDPANKWNLIAHDWYDYINTLLPSNIKISTISPNSGDPPELRMKGQCGYFKIEHPNGIYYCCLSASSNIFDVLEFQPIKN
jgi:hypothetical protein